MDHARLQDIQNAVTRIIKKEQAVMVIHKRVTAIQSAFRSETVVMM